MTMAVDSSLSTFSSWLPSSDRWFKTLNILDRSLSPVVQGGMGVGVSAHRLAGAVARENAMGTIASIDLRHHHPDLLEQTEKSRDRDLIDRVNLIALDREVRAALRHSEGRGVIAECQVLFLELGLGRDAPPLILAGGIDTHAKVRHWLNAGADAVQLGTAFAVSEEGDAHIDFKRVLLGAMPSNMVDLMSVAGLPMRAVSTHWLRQYQRQKPKMQASAKADPRRCSQRMDCLTQCGLRDGNSKAGQFCIDLKLASALKGDVQKGLFFRGAGRLPFGEAIRPVKDLIEYLLHGHPCQTPA